VLVERDPWIAEIVRRLVAAVAVDVLVTRCASFEKRAGVPTSLPATVLKEGVPLHAA
jgi:hypothetical protein